MSPSAPPGDTAGNPAPRRSLPERPSLEQLRKQAKDLLRDARNGDATALARSCAVGRPSPGASLTLADAQLVVAREYGFASWPRLVRHVESVVGSGFVLRPLIRPVELSTGRRWTLVDGTDTATDDAFAIFVAAREGDIAT